MLNGGEKMYEKAGSNDEQGGLWEIGEVIGVLAEEVLLQKMLWEDGEGRRWRTVGGKSSRYLYRSLGANGNNRHAQDQCWSIVISLLRGRWHYQHVSTFGHSMAVNCNLGVQGDDGIVVAFHHLGTQLQSIMMSLFKGKYHCGNVSTFVHSISFHYGVAVQGG